MAVALLAESPCCLHVQVILNKKKNNDNFICYSRFPDSRAMKTFLFGPSVLCSHLIPTFFKSFAPFIRAITSLLIVLLLFLTILSLSPLQPLIFFIATANRPLVHAERSLTHSVSALYAGRLTLINLLGKTFASSVTTLEHFYHCNFIINQKLFLFCFQHLRHFLIKDTL